MTNTINSLKNGGFGTITINNASSEAQAKGSDHAQLSAASSATPSNNSLAISDRARQLSMLEQWVAEAPDTNDARVEDMKKRIADGYQVDPERLAENLLQGEQEWLMNSAE